MKFRLTLFFVFQVVAWTAYFNWDSGPGNQNLADMSEKELQVQEMSTNQFTSIEAGKELYKLILRNDGFFTRINKDESVENGLWTVNYDVPSLVLKLPGGNLKYRILENTDAFLQVELMNTHELIQTSNTVENDRKLFSAIN